jgi:ribosomal protein S18 acetylase RimI-like enzyme
MGELAVNIAMARGLMGRVQDTIGSAGPAVRALEMGDVPAVSTIHRAAFPESALSRLGAGVVRRQYEWLLLGPHEVVALGAFDGDQLVGFCFGGVFKGAMSGFLQKNRVFLAWSVITHPWLATDPAFRGRLGEGVRILARYVRRRRRRSEGLPARQVRASEARSFGILSIAVDPRRQGTGAGKVLMRRSEEIAIERGFRTMDLTVHPENEQAVRFYERRGWERRVRDGGWDGVMTKRLAD